MTEVYHFLRLLFAKTGTQFCPDCDLPVEKQSVAAIVKQVESAAKRGVLKGARATRQGAQKVFMLTHWAERQGFDTLYVDGRLIPFLNFESSSVLRHTIDVVVGVIDARRVLNARDLTQRALENRSRHRASARLEKSSDCHEHRDELSKLRGRAFEELDPRLFSFNSPHGACEECGGFGEIWDSDLQTGASDNGESILENELAAEVI